MAEKSAPAVAAKSKSESKSSRTIVNGSYTYSGPIPHPSLLNQYDEKTRKVIVSMAQKQMGHRHHLESSVIDSNIRNEKHGMYLAFFITVVLIISGVVLLAMDKNIAGSFTIFGPAIFHAGNYIYNKMQENDVKEDNKDKK